MLIGKVLCGVFKNMWLDELLVYVIKLVVV